MTLLSSLHTLAGLKHRNHLTYSTDITGWIAGKGDEIGHFTRPGIFQERVSL